MSYLSRPQRGASGAERVADSVIPPMMNVPLMAMLVERLGGHVAFTDEDMVRADHGGLGYRLCQDYDHLRNVWSYWIEQPAVAAVAAVAEVVDEAPAELLPSPRELTAGPT